MKCYILCRENYMVGNQLYKSQSNPFALGLS